MNAQPLMFAGSDRVADDTVLNTAEGKDLPERSYV